MADIMYLGEIHMKVRLGFVTNSSSTSYICEVCGTQEEGYDGAPDGWFSCYEHGHTMCHACLKELHVIDADEEDNCPFCKLEMLCDSDMSRYLLKTKGITRETVFAEIKKVNRRRRVLRDNEYNDYVLANLNITYDVVLAEVKSQFDTYEKFRDFLRK
jgi:hypothetical protein